LHLGVDALVKYGPKALEIDYQDTGPRVEYMAFHSDHVHEPQRTGKSAQGGQEQQHISVANRLTVSRFRHLMSTAAGQKFLNENLHRTALLASHIHTMSPRKAMQASTMSRMTAGGMGGVSSTSQVESERPGQIPQAPTSYPLHVRVRAVVADWEVPSEKRSAFLIAPPVDGVDAGKQFLDEDSPARLRTAYNSPGSGQTQPLPASSNASPSRTAAAKTLQGGPPDRQLNGNLVRGTMEYLIREVMADKSFEDLVDEMLTQEPPFFLQFEDSAPPGESQHTPPEEPAAAPAIDVGSFEELMAERAEMPAAPWSSELLMDFLEPSFPTVTAASATPSKSDLSLTGPEKTLSSSLAGTSELPLGSSQAVLDKAMSEQGEVDLDAFKNQAGEVLDQMLLDMMGEVIGGRLNWTRPLPRVRGRGPR